MSIFAFSTGSGIRPGGLNWRRVDDESRNAFYKSLKPFSASKIQVRNMANDYLLW